MKLTAHSLIRSSQCVSLDSSSMKFCQSSGFTATFKFALIHVTIRVWKSAGARKPPKRIACYIPSYYKYTTLTIVNFRIECLT